MADLVACLGNDNASVNHVLKVIQSMEWENIFIISNNANKDNLKVKDKVTNVIIDETKYLEEIVDEIVKKLKGKIKKNDVALNLISGSGKEHMAVISALLKLGLGIRLIALTPKGVKEVYAMA